MSAQVKDHLAYASSAARVWQESNLKIQFTTPDGVLVYLTWQEAVDEGVDVKTLMERLAFDLYAARRLAFAEPIKTDEEAIERLEKLKDDLFSCGIESDDATVKIDTKIALLKKDISDTTALYVPGGHREPAKYVHALCDIYLALTGSSPGISETGPFHRFYCMAVKHFGLPNERPVSITTLRRYVDKWRPSKKVH